MRVFHHVAVKVGRRESKVRGRSRQGGRMGVDGMMIEGDGV